MKVFSLFGTSILTALGSSLCCIIPTISIVAGTSSLATSFLWLQPYRPYFISFAILTLGFAWYRVLFSQKDETCNCEPRPKSPFFKSRTFLSITTIFSVLLITFPTYSHIFVNDRNPFGQGTANEMVIIPVTGMTCTGCEMQVEEELKKVEGIISAKASHIDENTIVQYDNSKVNIDKIVEAINKTHYKAINPKIKDARGN